MDQTKIGQFIASLRKEQELTQRQLADKLGISDKTVSKWERGLGLPEVSLMLPLCQALRISVNELLSGERLDDTRYREKAEENMMNLVREREETKKKIWLSVAIVALTLISGITVLLVAGMAGLEVRLRYLLIGIGLVIILLGIGIACVLDRQAGTYECRHCHHRFVPSMGAYVAGMHSLTTRRLKCPHCGETTWCKRRLTH